MHTFRLLHMAREILAGQGLHVCRDHDREELLRIKSGVYQYAELLERAQMLVHEIDNLALSAPLPEGADAQMAERLAVGMRKEWYGV